ncbi:phage major capsid protein [Lactiplantibacillus plantarum]|uniref:phage major capsid protein n=1 Tax=Lactiplantibacillus plantarum TaxID=1590 RepID=UPI002ED8CAC2|nr:phage major capsid protein [Lactiplantibacillus plantarum]MCG0816988.1 phage major capsid protein [Lactiplantibacillus plantarum]MCG0842085.1 phage major capsid protein [Lactiplantibacillus plantarum]MCG0939178.1 phage major capsid protein [Lactiplantibacillus plantarum]MCG0948769.1 phage major capsid protein [Lactiplantibacillus plantarum]
MTLQATKSNQIDVRSLPTNFKTRDVQDNDGNTQHVISGVAVVFNQQSSPMPFVEVISDQAFNGVDLSDVKLLYSHDFGNILARTDAGTLQLDLTDNGLDFTATLPDTQLGHDVYTDILNGNLKGMSFGFTIEDDSWSVENGVQVHTINQIGVIAEISITSLPAYTETSLMVQRSLDKIATHNSESNESNNNNDKGDQIMAEDKKDQASEAPVSQAPAKDSQASEATQSQAPAKDSQASDPTSGKAVVTPEIVAQVVKAIQSMVKPADQPAGEQIRDDDSDDSSDDSGDDDSSDDSELEQDSDKTKLEKRDAENMKQIKPNAPKDLERDNFVNYLTKRDLTIADGTTTTSNGVALPHAVLKAVEKPANTNELVGLANHISVNAPAGTLPVLSATDVTLATAEELAENPKLAKMALSGVDYKLKTYRGAIPVSQELLDDADSNVQIEQLIGDYATQIHNNTLNADIATALKTATPSTVASFDDFKKAYNDTYKYSNRVVVISKSGYDALDTLKDNEGRYLLQDDIASATGKAILGAPVYVVEDKRLGTKDGDKVAFVGSVHSFVTVADFKDLRVKWTDDYVYGEQLQLIIREDTVVADKDAGKFLTLNFASSIK